MTIAACYVSPEGVVLGADSTATYAGSRFFNHTQKVFELGNGGTMGAVIWGFGGLGAVSYRTLFALLADSFEKASPASVKEAADRWIDILWDAISLAVTGDPSLKNLIDECRTLGAKRRFDQNAAPDPAMRTADEEERHAQLERQLQAGFCIGGYAPPDRTPAAWFLQFNLSATVKPTATQLPNWGFWGAPNMIQRLIFGADDAIKNDILASPKWSGTRDELNAIFAPYNLSHPIIPIRDAIDFIHACIHSTIKALKFSQLSPICGGPIELAVITTDRKFRWVRHKQWDAAITEGALADDNRQTETTHHA